MKTNDLKKGTRVQLRNGWFATLVDNAKGNTRCAEVEGYVTEIGSVYSHDIVKYFNGEFLEWDIVEHTPAQLKLWKSVEAFSS